MKIDIKLQGWLKKQKSKASVVGGDSNLRWFTIEAVHCEESKSRSNHHENRAIDQDEKEELALCYYKTSTSKDRNGWFFLADVTSLNQDETGQWITIVHPTRTYKLKAPNHKEHLKWFSTLSKYCIGTGNKKNSVEKELIQNLQPETKPLSIATASGTYVKKNHDSTPNKEEKKETEIDFLRKMLGKPTEEIKEEEKNNDEEKSDYAHFNCELSGPSCVLQNAHDDEVVTVPKQNITDFGRELVSETREKPELNEKTICLPNSSAQFTEGSNQKSAFNVKMQRYAERKKENDRQHFNRTDFSEEKIIGDTINKKIGRAILQSSSLGKSGQENETEKRNKEAFAQNMDENRIVVNSPSSNHTDDIMYIEEISLGDSDSVNTLVGAKKEMDERAGHCNVSPHMDEKLIEQSHKNLLKENIIFGEESDDELDLDLRNINTAKVKEENQPDEMNSSLPFDCDSNDELQLNNKMKQSLISSSDRNNLPSERLDIQRDGSSSLKGIQPKTPWLTVGLLSGGQNFIGKRYRNKIENINTEENVTPDINFATDDWDEDLDECDPEYLESKEKLNLEEPIIENKTNFKENLIVEDENSIHPDENYLEEWDED